MDNWHNLQESTNAFSDEDIKAILTGDDTVGPWQVIAALIMFAMKQDAIGPEQVLSAAEAGMMALAMHGFATEFDAVMGDGNPLET